MRYTTRGYRITMEAIFIHKEKDLRISTVETPQVASNQLKVKIERGGICGSDLHYYNNGGFGTNRLKEPMILGHEVSGTVIELGADISNFSCGDLVSVSPSRSCNSCQFCLQGLANHCLEMQFYGSAMPFPHIQGAFREQLVVLENQCVLANGLSASQAAMVEPLAVVLHALKQAGPMHGKNILITGAGPIGLLSILAAKSAGALSIVVTDISNQALQLASDLGASETINVADNIAALNKFSNSKGFFDIMFECSGSEQALLGAINSIKPRGVIVQLGMSGDMRVPMQFITTKEITLKGSFRFHEEFELGVSLMLNGNIDVLPLLSHSLPFQDAVQAFNLANDRTKSMKVQLVF